MGSGLQSYQPLRSAFPGILRMVGGPMLGFRAFISSLTGVRPTDAESFAALLGPLHAPDLVLVGQPYPA